MSMWGMAAYSIDLRQTILHAWERRRASQRALADLFGVRLAFIEQLIRRYRTTGAIAPTPHAGGQKPRLAAAADTLVRRLVHDHAASTVEARCARVAETRGVRVSAATMCRVLQRLG